MREQIEGRREQASKAGEDEKTNAPQALFRCGVLLLVCTNATYERS